MKPNKKTTKKEKNFCEHCGKSGAVADFRNFGVIWALCPKCADLPIGKLKNRFRFKDGKPTKSKKS